MSSIGVVPYLNALPLCYGLKEPLFKAPPSVLAEKINSGALDLALLPIFTYLSNPSLTAHFECGGIACLGAVESVCLFIKETLTHPREVARLSLTDESRTSRALTQVLYEKFWKKPWKELTLTDENPDGLLLIGDRALFFNEAGWKKIDLGEAWFEATHLPFLFAAWVSRGPLPLEMKEKLIQSKESGLKNLKEIAKAHPFAPHLYEYLSHSIRYEIDSATLDGLAVFKNACQELGLLK